MRITELMRRAGFATSNNQAVTLIRQGAVRIGWCASDGDTIELLDPVSDILHTIELDSEWEPDEDTADEMDIELDSRWFLFVGKRRAASLQAIANGTTERRPRTILKVAGDTHATRICYVNH